jgi:type III pantothenate kinase
MLLVIDVGNTNTVIGAMVDGAVHERWRVSTATRTTDETGLLLLQLLHHRGIRVDQLEGVIVSQVVPSVLYTIEKAARRYLDCPCMVVGRGMKTGMRVRTDNPREVGADRIVNAVAAWRRHRQPLVVVDFGTATTFDCVDHHGDYVGGVIAPGFGISADALFERTAKLPRVEVERPERAIGTNTIASMQSGLFYGYVGLVDGLARRCKEELAAGAGVADPSEIICLATGGLANLVGSACEEVEHIVYELTLEGLWHLWVTNSGRRPAGGTTGA